MQICAEYVAPVPAIKLNEKGFRRLEEAQYTEKRILFLL